MRLSIIPKNDIFFELFEQAGKNLSDAAVLLNKLLKNPADGDKLSKKIRKIEKQGNQVVRDIASQLQKSFVTPFDLEDINDLKNLIDSILDSIESLSEKIVLFRIENVSEAAVSLSKELVNSCALLEKISACLKKMHDPSSIVEKVRLSEKAADAIYRKAIGDLFSDKRIHVLEIIKWKEIYENLEDTVDFCREASMVMEGIILKHA
ncbi:hypothetical protein AUK11_00065 [bacterium CG2_30_37_16]|nr:MAG: hypothetical protein AUK11_00065 [bacterium CG2_30_37_16]PIP30564.1 MAG: hypothetical protein COX25_04030 [bacterium (Candidatus Howlettbacteria) CG23_combo_of_CG06-09_8_20_14_all_37_9]PJB06346.1 MAG: hypothetical protein CO123_02365 [bacterium (Candidatus Howlettbacteria) CG_4_9_14_3_um_filter_37_10]